MEALIFSAEGDLRQAINNMQATFSGFAYITPENVYRVCDQPHPAIISEIIENCLKGQLDGALDQLDGLFRKGYAPVDLVSTFFRVVKSFPNKNLPDALQLEFIKVSLSIFTRITFIKIISLFLGNREHSCQNSGRVPVKTSTFIHDL